MNYYITIQSQQHRESWSNILLLILAKLVRMPDDKVSLLQFVIFLNVPFVGYKKQFELLAVKNIFLSLNNLRY